jgi:hypothetical protein
LEKKGVKLGLFRYKEIAAISESGKPLLVVEMSLGQFVEDVKLSLLERKAGAPQPPWKKSSPKFSGFCIFRGRRSLCPSKRLLRLFI